MDSPNDQFEALKAALREARWQTYRLFNVQRQRAWFALHRERELVREIRQHVKALQRAKKLVGDLRDSIGKMGASLAGVVGGKRIKQMEDILAKCAAEWEPRVPENVPDFEDIAHPEDQDEALRVPFLTPTVEIVICVHNALEDVKRCLDSVLARSPKAQRLILVNDGSNEETVAYLDDFAAKSALLTEVIHNPQQIGYTIAANQGMKRSHADYTILLNSDTIVPHHWIESIVACGESDPDIGILGPLSNAASWQSVPERFAPAGDWEVNELPAGITVDDVACGLLLNHTPSYPKVPLINGFCIVIKRAVFQKIGYFDEETFPRGYGEENDFCLRAGKAGFKLAVADNAYIFHAKSKSFTHEKRRELSKNANQLLHNKHGQNVLDEACAKLRDDPGLAKARDAFAKLQNQKVPFRVLFVMDFKGEGGGTHSIVQETNGLCALGVFAQMAIREEHLAFYEEKYPGYPRSRFYAYQSEDELAAYAGGFDVVAATLFTSVELLKTIKVRHPGVVPAYYIQDYEPLFYAESDPLHKRARASYHLVPGTVCFAKTQWLQDTLKQRENLEVRKVTPSIDHTVYFPAADRKSGPLTVAAMVRPSTPRRSPELTVDVLTTLKREFGDKIQVVTFGAPATDPFWETNIAKSFQQRGVLTRQGVAEVLREADLFLDLSTYQAFGRTGLEAMACGCVPVVPKEGGSGEYAQDGENAFIVDTTNKDAILAKAREFLQADAAARQKMREAALATAKAYTVEAAARSEKELFETVLAARASA